MTGPYWRRPTFIVNFYINGVGRARNQEGRDEDTFTAGPYFRRGRERVSCSRVHCRREKKQVF